MDKNSKRKAKLIRKRSSLNDDSFIDNLFNSNNKNVGDFTYLLEHDNEINNINNKQIISKQTLIENDISNQLFDVNDFFLNSNDQSFVSKDNKNALLSTFSHNKKIVDLDQIFNIKFKPRYNISDDDFEVDEKLKIQKGKYRFKSIAYGIIIYGTRSTYSENKYDNTQIHLSIPLDEVLSILEHLCLSYGFCQKDEYIGAIAAHEHGKTNNKCHYQCTVIFDHPMQHVISPGEFDYMGKNYIFMYCIGKNPLALFEYCKKDGDFSISNEQRINEILKPKKDINNEALGQFISEILTKPTHQAINEALKFNPRFTVQNVKNIEHLIKYYGRPQLPEFAWSIPKHLLDSKVSSHIALINHVKAEIFEPDVSRRKCLILISQPNFGKTMFCNSLVSDPGYIVYVRGWFSQFTEIRPEHKLLILDDLFMPTNNSNYEIMKALASGQKTTIRAPYVNIETHSMPCIILTNNYDLVSYFWVRDDFSGRFNLIELKNEEDYLGPPGTYKPKFSSNDLTKMHISPLTLEKLEREKMKFNNSKSSAFMENYRVGSALMQILNNKPKK